MAKNPGLIDTVGRWLGGIERVDDSGLPVEEFAHPWPLLAMALLGVNDHVLKGSGWLPGWVTGKLSDFAGLFFFPLFVTAAVDTVWYLVFRISGGRARGYSLRLWKLYAAVGFTAILFVPLKLSDSWGTLYIRAMHVLDVFDWFGNFQVTRDPTDLVAVLMFPLVILLGRRFVRRIPMGRLLELSAAVRGANLDSVQRREVVAQGLGDVRRLLASSPGRREALDAFVEAYAATLDPKAKKRSRQRAATQLDAYRQTLEEPA